jgi:mRNA-degrading endonuclease toxin of MazEF toxin-antitoxin module
MIRITQRDIVEVNFELPDGTLKIHPALVISNQQVLDTEDIFYALMISTKPYNDEFTVEVKDSMLSKPLSKKSYVKCQLLQAYRPDEVLRRITSMKIDAFNEVKTKMFDAVF